nr:MAG TPA: hypothetical protein [Caudoviricetes sp.]
MGEGRRAQLRRPTWSRSPGRGSFSFLTRPGS